MHTLAALKKHRTSIAICVIVISLALIVLTFGIAGQHAPEGRLGWGTALGISISIAGLLVSFGGFSLTLSQLAEAAKDLDAAVKQSRKIQDFLTSYDAAQEASKASYALTAAKKHLANNAWTDAQDSYEDFRRGIISLCNNVEGINEKMREDVDKSTVYITRLASRIDRHVNSGFDQSLMPDKAKILTVLRTHAQLISDMSVVAQRKAFDVNDR